MKRTAFLMMMNNPWEHWIGMPDFEQEKLKPFAMVNMRFETEEDLIEFCKVTGLTLTGKTKSAWYPKKEPSDTGMKRWV